MFKVHADLVFVFNTDFNVKACRRSGGLVIFTSPTGMIKSPGYDENRYPNRAQCLWIINAPFGQVSLIRKDLLTRHLHLHLD